MQITNATTPTLVFLLVSSTDDKTAVTGLTPTVQISKNGGAFADTTNAASEIANGWYKVALTATETNTDGAMILRATGTGADEWRDVHEVAASRPANVVSIANNAITAAAIATDAIGAAELASDAVAEIQSGLMLASSYSAPPSAATIAAAVWDYLTSAASTVGSLGKLLVDNLNATVGSRLASASYTAPPSAADNATAVRSELTTELGCLDAAMTSRATPAQVNAEVVDVLSVDTYAEPGAVPAATSSLKDKIGWLFMLARNKRNTTGSADAVRNDADSATVATAALSDSGTTFSRGKYS